MSTEKSGTGHKSAGKGKAKGNGKDKVVHAIFGCGTVGYAVAKELKAQGIEVVIVDTDEKKVELLKEEEQDINRQVKERLRVMVKIR